MCRQMTSVVSISTADGLKSDDEGQKVNIQIGTEYLYEYSGHNTTKEH